MVKMLLYPLPEGMKYDKVYCPYCDNQVNPILKRDVRDIL